MMNKPNEMNEDVEMDQATVLKAQNQQMANGQMFGQRQNMMYGNSFMRNQLGFRGGNPSVQMINPNSAVTSIISQPNSSNPTPTEGAKRLRVASARIRLRPSIK